MNIVFRLAWRNLWRHPKRTWLTMGAMIFSNILLVFMMSFQFGMYGLMIENTLKIFTGHIQVQAPGYLDDKKMRQKAPDIVPLADSLRRTLQNDRVAARGQAFALASSDDSSCSIDATCSATCNLHEARTRMARMQWTCDTNATCTQRTSAARLAATLQWSSGVIAPYLLNDVYRP